MPRPNVIADTCELCNGTGWARTTGGSDAVVRCDCFVDARTDRLLERAQIPKRYRQCGLDNFEIDFPGAHPSLEEARYVCQKYVAAFDDLQHGILFMGNQGVGKTHLAVGVLRALIARYDLTGYFADYRDLLRDIQNSYNPISQTSEGEILRPILLSDVLLLDELGARRPTAWVQDTVADIINERYNQERVTLITTNFCEPKGSNDAVSLEERIGKPLVSRLYEMCRLRLIEGDDFRRNVKRAAF